MAETGYGKRIVSQMDGKSVGGTVLDMKEGRRTDMAFHIHTEKVLYVLKGSLTAWVIKDGKMASLALSPGNSLYVKPGLVHQLEAIEPSVVIEYVSDVSGYDGDTYVVTKGSVLEQKPVPDGDFAKMTPDDESKLTKPKAVKKAAKKKRKSPTKKKVRRNRKK